jgi:hypothetical protein
MLENLVKGSALKDETAVRSALYLSRDHGRQDLVGRLVETTRATRRDALRGLAAAALMDAGQTEAALSACGHLAISKHPCTTAWAALVLARGEGRAMPGELVSEPRFRRVQLGWVE